MIGFSMLASSSITYLDSVVCRFGMFVIISTANMKSKNM